MSDTTIKRLTTYYSHGESYLIGEYSEAPVDFNIVAINHKYITNGRLNTTLRGFEMFTSDSVAHCISKVEASYKKQELLDAGYSMVQAIVLANGGTLEEAKELEERMQELNAGC